MSPNRWYCQYNGCGRDFGRREHLERHSLNHADGEFTCERCRAHFKRADLLGEIYFLFPFFFGFFFVWIIYCRVEMGREWGFFLVIFGGLFSMI